MIFCAIILLIMAITGCVVVLLRAVGRLIIQLRMKNKPTNVFVDLNTFERDSAALLEKFKNQSEDSKEESK